MSLRRDFQTAVHDAARAHDVAAVLPEMLVHACTAVLPVDGAGMSVDAELRLPLAASSAAAAQAERLQTTLGDGPCLTVLHTDRPVAAGLDELRRRWPVYASELVATTPFRSVASLPLRVDGRQFGAIDLYSVHPVGYFGVLEQLVDDVVDPLGAVLTGTSEWFPAALSGFGAPTASASRRLQVWTAVGMVVADLGLTTADALALLRGYAYSHGLDLDTLADLVVIRTISTAAIRR